MHEVGKDLIVFTKRPNFCSALEHGVVDVCSLTKQCCCETTDARTSDKDDWGLKDRLRVGGLHGLVPGRLVKGRVCFEGHLVFLWNEG